MSYEFHPPRTNPLVVAGANLILPLFLPVHDQVARVVIDPKDWGRLEALRGHRALLLANHPSETEPVIMAWLSRRLREPFNYLATHEMFGGLRGWVVNRIGAFTIRRGWPDRRALRMAVGLLADQDRKLVVFPEGETHMQNDLVLPLHEGAVQIGFWALERLERVDMPARLPIVPIATRYRYVGDARPALERGTGRLERELGLEERGELPLTDRLYRAGLTVLDGVEREYGIRASERGGTVDERIAALYDYITQRVSHVLCVEVPQLRPVHLGMRALFNAAFDYLDGLARGDTPYERRLHARRAAAVQTCIADLLRVQNFMTVSADYLAPPAPYERLGEVLFRLEKEVFGRPRTLPMREALVRIGEPVELAGRLPAYRSRRRETLAQVTREMEERLRSLLGSSAA